jgi:hypothetical protein
LENWKKSFFKDMEIMIRSHHIVEKTGPIPYLLAKFMHPDFSP